MTVDEIGTEFPRAQLEECLRTNYMPVDLDTPGLRLLNYDPPIFVIEGLLEPELANSVVEAAEGIDALQPSTIGSKTLGTAGNSLSARRTSSSLLIDADVQRAHPSLKDVAVRVQDRIRRVLPGGSWGVAGRLPARSQFCFEALQLARYTHGQHFLAHEDGFPVPMAAENGFQRSATFVMYLNDVEAGGLTRFELLDLAVRPRRGQALLFFPAFASGEPDGRTLHTAEDAADTKWIAQQWVARGYAPSGASAPAVPALSSTAAFLKQGSARGALSAKRGPLTRPPPASKGFTAPTPGARATEEPARKQRSKVKKGNKGASGPKKGFGA